MKLHIDVFFYFFLLIPACSAANREGLVYPSGIYVY